METAHTIHESPRPKALKLNQCARRWYRQQAERRLGGIPGPSFQESGVAPRLILDQRETDKRPTIFSSDCENKRQTCFLIKCHRTAAFTTIMENDTVLDAVVFCHGRYYGKSDSHFHRDKYPFPIDAVPFCPSLVPQKSKS